MDHRKAGLLTTLVAALYGGFIVSDLHAGRARYTLPFIGEWRMIQRTEHPGLFRALTSAHLILAGVMLLLGMFAAFFA